MLSELESDDFSGLVGEVFEAHLPQTAPIRLELAAVTDLGAPRMPAGRRPFSLLFLGPPSRLYLTQGIYHLQNAALGGIELFIVPLGPRYGHPEPGGTPQARMQYEAVFN